MKSVALLHTVKSVYLSFGDMLKEAVGELIVYNMLDDFLALDANARGEFTKNNFDRLALDLQSLEKTGADAIIVTCSTLTPHLDRAGKGLKTPIFAIDEAMVDIAARTGGRVVLMATAKSAVEPITRAIEKRAGELGNRVSMEAIVLVEAMTALRAGDRDRHDELLLEAAKRIEGKPDVVVLAQASMAHMDESLEKALGCAVLQSPKLCVERVREFLKGGNANEP